jgi:hypothetical protein
MMRVSIIFAVPLPVRWMLKFFAADELPAGDLAIDQSALLVKLKVDLDLLEAARCAHEHLAAVEAQVRVIVVGAQVIVQIDSRLEDLFAAVAAGIDPVGALIAKYGGGEQANKFFEEAHGYPFMNTFLV